MKQIFAVRGIEKCGKSSCIKKIYEILRENYPKAYVDIINEGYDITVIVVIDEIKIGIESAGDPNSRLPSSLKRFEQEDCKIIVCATRTRGGTVKAVENLANFAIKWFHKQRQKNEDEENRKMAENIFKMIQSVITTKTS
ncbi:MAG: hypothetical protein PHC99_10765 [Methylococcales bacterium]|nr:hypothetical protein [Methylococcales bacterium]